MRLGACLFSSLCLLYTKNISSIFTKNRHIPCVLKGGGKATQSGLPWGLASCTGPSIPETSPHKCLHLYRAYQKTKKPQASIAVDVHCLPTAIFPGTHAHHLLLCHCCGLCRPPRLSPPLPCSTVTSKAPTSPVEGGTVSWKARKCRGQGHSLWVYRLHILGLHHDLFAALGLPARFLKDSEPQFPVLSPLSYWGSGYYHWAEDE